MRAPIEFVLPESGGDARGIYAAFSQLRCDPPGAIAAAGAGSGVGIRKPAVVLQALGREIVQRMADFLAVQTLARQFLLEFARTVFAPGERVDRAIARTSLGAFLAQASASRDASSVSSSVTPVERGIAISRMDASSSAAIAGLSLRNCRAFSLPCPRRSPL